MNGETEAHGVTGLRCCDDPVDQANRAFGMIWLFVQDELLLLSAVGYYTKATWRIVIIQKCKMSLSLEL